MMDGLPALVLDSSQRRRGRLENGGAVQPLKLAEAPSLGSGGCRWPLWPNNERPGLSPRFCNEERAEGRIVNGIMKPCPYCEKHAEIAYPFRKSTP